MASQSDKKNALKVAIGSVDMKNTGRKLGEMPTLSSSKDKMYYPTVHVSSKEVPGLKGKTAGDYVTIVVHACIKSHTSNESGDDYRLDLEKIGVVNPKSDSAKEEAAEDY